MIPKNILCISRTSFRQYLVSTGRRTTSVLKPANEFTHQMMSQPVRLYTYSFLRSICNSKTVNFKQLNRCPRLVSREIQTNVNESTQSEQQQSIPLSIKRQRKKILTTIDEKHEKLVVAYPLAEETDLEKVETMIQKRGLYQISQRLDDMTDVLHLTSKYKVGEEQLRKEFFIFREGSLVCWNVPEVERIEMIKLLLKNTEEPYNFSLILEDRESMEYSTTQNEPNVIGDRLIVKDEEQEINLDKYTFSNALSQSVKLAFWESSLEKFIDSIENLSEDLRLGKRVSLSRQQVLRKLGEIFTLRHSINLSSDLLDTPDFYWDRETLELLYHKSCTQLNLGRRTKVMNEKLNHCCDLLHLIDNKKSDERHVRLEWMIIILIMIEVGFESAKYI